MLRLRLLQTIFFGAIFAAFPAVLNATTVDTFTFSLGGFHDYDGDTASLTGTFTGAVEPGGLIELGDLSAFSATFSFPALPDFTISNLNSNDLFSFNTHGGASSLAISTVTSTAQHFCVGAPASLGCQGLAVPDTTGLLFPFYFTDAAPTVTLESSVTTPTPVPTTAPEPSELPLCGASFLLLVLFRTRRQRGARHASCSTLSFPVDL